MELPTERGATFRVRIKPNASSNETLEYEPARGVFEVRIAAAPDKGKANEELLKHLKKAHGLSCEIISGHSARTKLLRVRGHIPNDTVL